jgi:hypothetical protein
MREVRILNAAEGFFVTAGSRNVQNVVVAILLPVWLVVEFKFFEDFSGMCDRVM